MDESGPVGAGQRSHLIPQFRGSVEAVLAYDSAVVVASKDGRRREQSVERLSFSGLHLPICLTASPTLHPWWEVITLHSDNQTIARRMSLDPVSMFIVRIFVLTQVNYWSHCSATGGG